MSPKPDCSDLPDDVGPTIDRRAKVPRELAGERVDRAAAVLFGEFSRASLTGWIQSGALTVDARAVKPKVRLFGGETLRLHARIEAGAAWNTAQPVAFDCVYEDAALLVVNKPAGVVVHPGAGNADRTLVNGLLAHRPALRALPRAGIVHRLDKDTSGLLVVAATPAAHTALVRALAERRVRRGYLAIAEGLMVAGRTIDAPIGRDPFHRTRQAVRADGRAAVTHVRVRERYRAHTLVHAELETGRTHQIRVHMASIGHPLVGDRRYGARGRLPPRPSLELVQELRAFDRQALHAAELAFDHPETGAPLAFEAPPPADFEHLLEALRRDADA